MSTDVRPMIMASVQMTQGQRVASNGQASAFGQPAAVAQESRVVAVTPDQQSFTRGYVAAEVQRLDQRIAELAAKKARLQVELDSNRALYATSSSWGIVLLSVGTSLPNAGISRNEVKRLEKTIAEIDTETRRMHTLKLNYLKIRN